MDTFEPSRYGAVFASLLTIDRRRPLDAGTPDKGARGELQRLSIESAFEHATITDREMASCCISGVWLLHDFLDESHTISQSIETPSGSYWHAIMHRREGDFSNSKYWLRRVGRHPVFEEIGDYVSGSRLRGGSEWDPYDFVDRCEAVVHGKHSDGDYCLDFQQAEWELLFDFCYRGAIGA